MSKPTEGNWGTWNKDQRYGFIENLLSNTFYDSRWDSFSENIKNLHRKHEYERLDRLFSGTHVIHDEPL